MNDIIDVKNQELIENVKEQINTVNMFLGWTLSHLSETRKIETFKKLIDKRRKLKRLLFSISSNPAIAAFGESQKGKSYVISSLLASKGEQFKVQDKDGKFYNFIEEMNPHTNNTEATGVVTRFTKNYQTVDDDYPIKVKLLSVSDILQILCDTAYQDVKTHSLIKEEDINAFMQTIERRFAGMPEVQDFIQEDDIFNIREYIEKYMKNVAYELLSSSFFDVLALNVRKIQPKDWASVMSKLWYDNPEITDIFKRILKGYEALGFASELYIPISALLNSHTTLMSSACLQNMVTDTPITGNTDLNLGTDVLFIADNGAAKVLKGFSKSVLSSMTAEVVFKIMEESINEQLVYHLEGINDESVRSMLVSRGWNQKVTKEFLNTVDILDFPGARSRLELDESQIPMELSMQMLLRGKVSYLFNKYSDEKLINVLMLCHDYEQNGQAAMPPILNKWVSRNIGYSSKERSEYIDKSVVSPLFIIATKFNVDLRVDVNSTGNEQLDSRWNDRFMKVLYNQVLMATSNSWFDDWTEDGAFKNIYLLRDYKYSGDRGNRIFNGYSENGVETSENDAEFRFRLKQSFLANENVNRFFDCPEQAWDSACTLNNDGTVYIIQKLSIVAANANESRYFKRQKEVKLIQQAVLQLMMEYYHDENEDNILQKAIARAGSIAAEFDVVYGHDNYFFGRMIHQLQISENYVFDFFYNELNNTRMISHRDMKEYDIILSRCHGRIKPDNTWNENLEILRQEYHFPTCEECKEFFEQTKHVSLDKLFECDSVKKSNSEQLAEGIVQKWLHDISDQKHLKFFENEKCNTLAVLDMIENMKSVIASCHLVQRISRMLSTFVDSIAVPNQILDMIADITAETINEFVTDFGYFNYSAEKLEDLKVINEKHSLNLSFKYGQMQDSPKSLEELSSMFDEIRPTDDVDAITLMPSHVSYNNWIELLMISFIASYDVPSYDVEANRCLGELLGQYKQLV